MATEVNASLILEKYQLDPEANSLTVQMRTDRLVLRSLTEAAIDQVVELTSDHDHMRFTELKPELLSAEDRKKKLLGSLKKFQPEKSEQQPSPFGLYTVWANDVLVGVTDFHPDYEGVMRLGCVISKSQEGKGFGQEVTIAMVKFVFQHLRKQVHALDKLAIGTRVDHPCVNHIMKKLDPEGNLLIGEPWTDKNYTPFTWVTYTLTAQKFLSWLAALEKAK